MDPKDTQATGTTGKKSRKQMIAEEQARRASASGTSNGTATMENPAADNKSKTEENSGPSLSEILGNVLNSETTVEEKEKPQVEQQIATPETPTEVLTQSEAEVEEHESVASALEALSTRLVVLEERISEQGMHLRSANQELAHLTVEFRLDNIKNTVADVVNQTAELGVSAAFGRHNKEFAQIWDPRLSQVLQAVQNVRQEMQGALGDLSELRMYLPVMRQLSQVNDQLNEMKKVRDEVMAAKEQILNAVKSLRPQQATASVPSTPPKPSGLFGN